MTDIELIERAVEEEAERILAANDRIWEFAELPFHEDKSAGRSADCWRNPVLP